MFIYPFDSIGTRCQPMMSRADQAADPVNHETERNAFLQRSEVAALLDFDVYVRRVEDAFRAHAQGRSLAPGLLHIDAQGGEFHIKAGGLCAGQPRFGIKINGGFFENRVKFDMPNIQGVILLNDATNGYPLCVMDSVEVTVQRTGAATAAAARYLARPESSVSVLCGLGNQGRIQLKAVARTLPIRKVYAWSPFPGEPEASVFRSNRPVTWRPSITTGTRRGARRRSS